MKHNILIIALVCTHNLFAAQQKSNLKRPRSPIQSIDDLSIVPMQIDATMAENQNIDAELNPLVVNAVQNENPVEGLRRLQELFNSSNTFIPDINAQMERSQDPLINNMTPLMFVAEKGDEYLDLAKFLIAHGADLNKETDGGLTALGIALTASRHIRNNCGLKNADNTAKIARILIEAGADFNKGTRGRTLLETAAYTCTYRSGYYGSNNYLPYEDLFFLLLKKGARASEYALHDNIQKLRQSDTKILLGLLDAGANINALNDDGDTPLMRLIRGGCFPACEKAFYFLLTRGANPYIRNKDGENSFDIAKRYEEFGKRLAEYKKLQTPQHIAALQAVAQKSMQGLTRSARHEGMEEPAMLVQQYLRPDYRTEAENKEKENKSNITA